MYTKRTLNLSTLSVKALVSNTKFEKHQLASKSLQRRNASVVKIVQMLFEKFILLLLECNLIFELFLLSFECVFSLIFMLIFIYLKRHQFCICMFAQSVFVLYI